MSAEWKSAEWRAEIKTVVEKHGVSDLEEKDSRVFAILEYLVQQIIDKEVEVEDFSELASFLIECGVSIPLDEDQYRDTKNLS